MSIAAQGSRCPLAGRGVNIKHGQLLGGLARRRVERTSDMTGNGSVVSHMPLISMPATWLVMRLLDTRYLTLSRYSPSLPGKKPSRSWYTPYRSAPCCQESSRPPSVICGNWQLPRKPDGWKGLMGETKPSRYALALRLPAKGSP